MKVRPSDCNHRLSKFVVADENDHAPAMPVISRIFADHNRFSQQFHWFFYMNNNTKIFDDVEIVSKNLLSVFERMKEVPGMYDDICDKKKSICRAIPEQIRSGVVKIAVVGSIKSGKSTFINSFLNEDLLKRGAGVVTSIITKVRKGDISKATILLKSWDEINQEIEKALLFFPDFENRFIEIDEKGFDLRRKNDRKLLKKVNEQLRSDLSVTKKGIRPESIILAHAMEGYEFVKDVVQADASTIEFTNKRFQEHKKFAGTDSFAFFVKDVSLSVVTKGLDPQIEIADCQGSDSTNPLHMTQIEDYLVSASLIIYLISSRTGLREADIRFLTIIQKMGLMDNILFVVNSDFSEHESLEDLITVEKTIKNELAYFKSDIELFTFSSLYNLFCKSKQDLSIKNLKRLNQWKEDFDFVNYSDTMKSNFDSTLAALLKKKRFMLLVANHIEHIRIIANDAEKRAEIFNELLNENVSKAGLAVENLKDMHKRARQLKLIVKDSMKSAVKSLNFEIDAGIKLFFDKSRGRAVRKIRNFILSYSMQSEKYEAELLKSGFHNAFYFMFQDFKKEFDIFVTEDFNPEVVGFINEQEHKIEDYFRSVFHSYSIDPFAVCTDFSEISEKYRKDSGKQNPYAANFINIESVRRILGLSLPKALFTIKYNARIRVDSMARFGFHSITEIFARILQKKSRHAGLAALRDAGIKIKKEALKSILLNIVQYQNYLKNDYLFSLTKALSRDFEEKIIGRFRESDLEIENIKKLMNSKHNEKREQADTLEVIKSMLKDTCHRIDTLGMDYQYLQKR